MNNLVKRTFALSELMCGAAEVPLYTTVLIANSDREILAIKKGWAGGEPDHKSCGPFVGPLKASELLWNLTENFAMTPTDHPLGTGYMGGVQSRSGEAHFVTAASAWSEMCDAQHALALMHAMLYEVRMHHVGFRHPSEEAMWTAAEADEERFNSKGLYLPVRDHMRIYIPIDAPLAPNGVYWREHQFFPEGPKSHAIHWDLATNYAIQLLEFIGINLGVGAIIWEPGPNDPTGVVWADNKGTPFGIMARDHWWNVGE